MVRDAANKIAEAESDEKLYDSFLNKVSDEADAE
jgi:F-type H+-transporting ATPase subunit b